MKTLMLPDYYDAECHDLTEKMKRNILKSPLYGNREYAESLQSMFTLGMLLGKISRKPSDLETIYQYLFDKPID